MVTREERATRQRFTDRYGQAPSDVTDQIERTVIGAAWGANGYTTVRQADLLGELLDLRPGTRLLDIGAGRGWPGLYLAARTACRVVLTDVPIEGLRLAAARAETEAITERVATVAATARALPFQAGSFDAVVQTDVL
jgi:ubiquinone/menaquinone biosynthesis C-methylase UbiE